MFHAIGVVIATILSMAVAYVCFLAAVKLVHFCGFLLGIAASKTHEEIEKRRTP